MRLAVEDGADLARDPGDRQAVGPVRRDLELEDRVRKPGVLGEGHAHGRIGGQDHQPFVVVAEPQLTRRAVHAARLDAAQLGLLDGHAVGQRRADERDRHLVAGLEVLRAAHDLQRLLAADVDLGDPELVGLGVLRLLDDLTDDDVVERSTGTLGGLDGRAGQVEPIDEFRQRDRYFDEFFEPLERNEHLRVLPRSRVRLRTGAGTACRPRAACAGPGCCT